MVHHRLPANNAKKVWLSGNTQVWNSAVKAAQLLFYFRFKRSQKLGFRKWILKKKFANTRSTQSTNLSVILLKAVLYSNLLKSNKKNVKGWVTAGSSGDFERL